MMGLGTMARFGVIAAGSFVASVLVIDGCAQRDAHLCHSSIASFLIRFKHMI